MAYFLDIAPKRKTPAARKVCVLKEIKSDPGRAEFFVYLKSGPAGVSAPNLGNMAGVSAPNLPRYPE